MVVEVFRRLLAIVQIESIFRSFHSIKILLHVLFLIFSYTLSKGNIQMKPNSI